MLIAGPIRVLSDSSQSMSRSNLEALEHGRSKPTFLLHNTANIFSFLLIGPGSMISRPWTAMFRLLVPTGKCHDFPATLEQVMFITTGSTLQCNPALEQITRAELAECSSCPGQIPDCSANMSIQRPRRVTDVEIQSQTNPARGECRTLLRYHQPRTSSIAIPSRPPLYHI